MTILKFFICGAACAMLSRSIGLDGYNNFLFSASTYILVYFIIDRK